MEQITKTIEEVEADMKALQPIGRAVMYIVCIAIGFALGIYCCNNI
jgi:hypothetical protein